MAGTKPHDNGSIVEQEGGVHYEGTPIQHWDWAQYIGYLEGCATKYIGRHENKNGLEDIRKSLSYVDKILRKVYGCRLRWCIEKLDGSESPEEECDYNVND